jgi:predicted dehydrogenase
MNMEHGIIATTSIGRTPVPHINGYGGDMTIRVMGTHGMLYVDANRPRWVSYSRSGASAIKYGPDKLYDTVDHFVGCVLNDTQPMCSAQEARTTLEVTLAALQSAAENRTVRLPLEV